MAAITQRLLRIRPVGRRDIRRFSSSSDSEPRPRPPDDPQPESEPAPSFSSYLKEVRAHLKREPTLENRPKPFSFSNRSPPPPRQSTSDSIEQISRNLSEFRARDAAPHRSSGSGQHVSLQELYNRNVISNPDDSVTPSNSGGIKRPSFEIIRQSLQDFRTRSPSAGSRGDYRSDASDPLSIERLKENLKANPDRNLGEEKVTVIGGTDLPYFMRNDIKGSEENAGDKNEGMRTALVKAYGYKELGEELKKLRSDKRKGKWFSLNELNERLAKLKEITEKNSQNAMGGIMKGIRELITDSALKAEQNKKKLLHRLDILGAMGGTPKYMLKDPKENLVEKYYHPDNMSSAEKLKLELQKVRDEFKMSESDCGSARVQVAQLTTKIKHLSNVLSKKDKHSRKGLQDMVQRRKKLLKYLRRTDWDSYTLVLSKLGLRDNPVTKA